MTKRAQKKQIALAAYRAQIAEGWTSVCPLCNKWFKTYQERNTHRAECPKRRK